MIKTFIKSSPFLYHNALAIKQALWRRTTKKASKKYLKNNKSCKLQLGAGNNKLTNWFNTDYFARPSVFFLDVTKKFTLPDNVFDVVFSEHHIEHISYKDAQLMLAETFRVMKPGGYIKIATPNLEHYLLAYTNKQLQSQMVKTQVKDWIYSGFAHAANYIPVDDYYDAHFINDIFLNYEHRFIYDENTLKALFVKAGFSNIKLITPEDDDLEVFKNIDTHVLPFDKAFTLALQAQKL